MTEHELTRRRLLALGLALPPLVALAGSDLFAGELLAATPAIADDDEPTPAQTEGPYFTPNSPLRRSIVPAGAAGIRLTLTGRVLTTAGKPVARALIDVWQANAGGAYDNPATVSEATSSRTRRAATRWRPSSRASTPVARSTSTSSCRRAAEAS